MEMKNICGKIPLNLHEKVRQEIELTESSTQKFLWQVIEEHFSRKGEVSMGTVAVQVSEEFFSRLKAVVARTGYKQKDFLIAAIERAIEEEEARWREEESAEETPEPDEAELLETEESGEEDFEEAPEKDEEGSEKAPEGTEDESGKEIPEESEEPEEVGDKELAEDAGEGGEKLPEDEEYLEEPEKEAEEE